MKKKKIIGKLNLNKETISKLNNEEMSKVDGGLKTFFCLTTLNTRGCDATVGGNTCSIFEVCIPPQEA